MRSSSTWAAAVAALCCLGACKDGDVAPPSASRQPAQETSAAPAGRPNVLIYLMDSLRPDHLGVYGYSRGTSPAIDAWARQAVVFDHALAPASWTRPSVGSLFTGLLPPSHGAVRPDRALRGDVPTMAERFRALGYATAAFITNAHISPVFGFDRGFDLCRYLRSGERGETADRVNAALFDYLSSRAAKPFFLYVHTRDTHRPFEPPAAFARRFVARRAAADEETKSRLAYIDGLDASIAFADDQFGRLLDELERRQLSRSTIVVLMADHGEELFEHGDTGHGTTLNEEVLRIPLVIALPGQTAGRRVAPPVRVVDLLPTLLELVGAEAPADTEATSFAALVGPSQGPVHYSPELLGSLAVGTNGGLESWTSGRYKIIRPWSPDGSAAASLFDLATDSTEQTDISQSHPDLARHLAAELDRVLARINDGVYVELAGRPEGPDTSVAMSIEALQCPGGSWSAMLPAGGSTLRAPSQSRRELDGVFRHRPNPTEFGPRSIVDRARFRLVGARGGCRIRVALRLDGAWPPHGFAILGDGVPVDLPFEVTVDDPRLQAAPPLADDERVEGRLQVYRIALPPSVATTLDADTRARLRALGYTDEGAPPGRRAR